MLLQEDIKAAVEYAEGQIRRLLSGQVELWELPLTGGLWRVTGDWLEVCCECLLATSCPALCWLPGYGKRVESRNVLSCVWRYTGLSPVL